MKAKLPLEIRAGSVRVKIYKTESRGYPLFQVADFSEGRRKLRSFADLTEAKAEAQRIDGKKLSPRSGLNFNDQPVEVELNRRKLVVEARGWQKTWFAR